MIGFSPEELAWLNKLPKTKDYCTACRAKPHEFIWVDADTQWCKPCHGDRCKGDCPHKYHLCSG